MGQSYQVNPCVNSSQVKCPRKLIPKPDGLKEEGILGVCFQVCLHQTLESIAFVSFREGDLAVFLDDVVKTHLNYAKVIELQGYIHRGKTSKRH